MRPHLKEFMTLQDLWSNQEPPSESSRWHENWKVREVY